MGAGHSHAGARHRSRLAIGFALIAGFFVVELIAALWSGSLTLLSDAGHMAADVVTLGAALIATVVASRPDRSGRWSYGRYRVEVFAALLAVLMMLGVAAFVVVEAIERFGQPAEVASTPMLVVGLLGLLVNLIVLKVLHEGAAESLNVKGAYLEVLADAAGSVGVLIAGGLVLATGQPLWDTIVALALGVFVAIRAVLLGREVFAILGQHVPAGIDPAAVTRDLAAIEGVADVHDLHLWTLTSGMNVATAHLVSVDHDGMHPVLDAARELLHDRYGIEHATLQVEPADHHGCAEVDW
ncbi:cation transporter [Enemella dayhoffiae]|uniref:Cation transporter n=1 Tax=Enemella dayhoffiae TaxID=2016507 RepID=A0A255HFJ1_9ACTN|nr:cation diffusion facilitator family transporter [Enemella dayhoffiae]OYO25204.1 cation transporter [Enemella dayhoffiae]